MAFKHSLAIIGTGRIGLLKKAIRQQNEWRRGYEANGSPDAYLESVFSWCHRAHAASGTGGVPKLYCALRRRYEPPYPETSGYLVPTLLNTTILRRFGQAREIALSICRWLTDRQQPDGSIRCNIERAGDKSRAPLLVVSFDMGAILQGLCAGAVAFGAEFSETAAKAANFLHATQNGSGFWDKNLMFNYYGSHNSLNGYALILAGDIFNEPKWTAAGRSALTCISSRLQKTGYISGCHFDDSSYTKRFFLHPYAYTIEGYLKSFLANEAIDFLDLVRPCICWTREEFERTDALLFSHYDTALNPISCSSAMTANAQVADLWLIWARITGESHYVQMAGRLLRKIRYYIDLDDPDADARGGLPGSVPLGGDYFPFRYPNWGAKYFLDASVRELENMASNKR